MSKKRTVAILVGILMLLLVFLVVLPLSFDSSLGADSLPDSAFYEIELAGENIACGISLDRKACLLELANERDQEVEELNIKQRRLFDEDEKQQYELLIIKTENAASRLRIEALK
ncbi:MAG: hypothetical protein ABIJ92_04230 [Candidatus Aenigmatarchaeota archaeon]